MEKIQKPQIVTKLQSSNFDKIQKLKLEETKQPKKNAKKFFGNKNLTPSLPMRYF